MFKCDTYPCNLDKNITLDRVVWLPRVTRGVWAERDASVTRPRGGGVRGGRRRVCEIENQRDVILELPLRRHLQYTVYLQMLFFR